MFIDSIMSTQHCHNTLNPVNFQEKLEEGFESKNNLTYFPLFYQYPHLILEQKHPQTRKIQLDGTLLQSILKLQSCSCNWKVCCKVGCVGWSTHGFPPETDSIITWLAIRKVDSGKRQWECSPDPEEIREYMMANNWTRPIGRT